MLPESLHESRVGTPLLDFGVDRGDTGLAHGRIGWTLCLTFHWLMVPQVWVRFSTLWHPSRESVSSRAGVSSERGTAQRMRELTTRKLRRLATAARENPVFVVGCITRDRGLPNQDFPSSVARADK